ncbi:hypothetical protein NPIL_492501, partial [Nephila pilipes]
TEESVKRNSELRKILELDTALPTDSIVRKIIKGCDSSRQDGTCDT